MRYISLINSTTPSNDKPVNNDQGFIGVMYDEDGGNA